MKYAHDTLVSVERSKAEIERLVRRYGATEFASGWKAGRAVIQFKMQNRYIRFVVGLPDQSEFRNTPSGRRQRSDNDTLKAWEQGCRQRWRALALAIKGKLESAESGIETFESAFLGQVVMPNGRTIAEQVVPVIESAYASGKMPALLLDY